MTRLVVYQPNAAVDRPWLLLQQLEGEVSRLTGGPAYLIESTHSTHVQAEAALQCTAVDQPDLLRLPAQGMA